MAPLFTPIERVPFVPRNISPTGLDVYQRAPCWAARQFYHCLWRFSWEEARDCYLLSEGLFSDLMRFSSHYCMSSVLLYSSEEPSPATIVRDANVYQPFNNVDSAVADRIREHLIAIEDDTLRKPSSDDRRHSSCSALNSLAIGLVGAITKGLCRMWIIVLRDVFSRLHFDLMGFLTRRPQ